MIECQPSSVLRAIADQLRGSRPATCVRVWRRVTWQAFFRHRVALSAAPSEDVCFLCLRSWDWAGVGRDNSRPSLGQPGSGNQRAETPRNLQPKPQMPSHVLWGGKAASSTMTKSWLGSFISPRTTVSWMCVQWGGVLRARGRRLELHQCIISGNRDRPGCAMEGAGGGGHTRRGQSVQRRGRAKCARAAQNAPHHVGGRPAHKFLWVFFGGGIFSLRRWRVSVCHECLLQNREHEMSPLKQRKQQRPYRTRK